MKRVFIVLNVTLRCCGASFLNMFIMQTPSTAAEIREVRTQKHESTARVRTVDSSIGWSQLWDKSHISSSTFSLTPQTHMINIVLHILLCNWVAGCFGISLTPNSTHTHSSQLLIAVWVSVSHKLLDLNSKSSNKRRNRTDRQSDCFGETPCFLVRVWCVHRERRWNRRSHSDTNVRARGERRVGSTETKLVSSLELWNVPFLFVCFDSAPHLHLRRRLRRSSLWASARNRLV